MAEKAYAVAYPTASGTTIEVLFNGSLRFLAPRFQRDYCWEVDQLEEFWSDLQEAWQDGKMHYMGSMLFQQVDENTRIIVDGQQRLTTFTLMLVAADRAIKSIKSIKLTADRLNDTFRQYVFLPDPDFREEDVARLQLNRHNQVVLDELVRTLTIPSSKLKTPFNVHIINALEFFDHKLKRIGDIELIEKFTLASLTGTMVISIVTDLESSAYKIYECLNSRGKEMTDSDLIKNHVFCLTESGGPHALGVVESCWKQLMTLSNARVDEYIRAVLMLEEGHVSKDALMKVIKEIVTDPSSAVWLAELLNENLDLYFAISDEDTSRWNKYQEKHNKVRQELKDLAHLGKNSQKTILMAAMGKFNINDMAEFVTLLEKYIVRNNVICNNSLNKQEKALCDIGSRIWHGDLKFHGACQELKKLMPSDRNFKRAFSKARFNLGTEKKNVQYIFQKIELYSGNVRNFKNATIEHVLPVNYTSQWAKLFNKDYVSDSVGRLGNMTFLNDKKNSKIGNRLFREKKPIFANSEYAITKLIAEYDKWNYRTLERHQRHLAEIAVEIW